MNVSGGVGELKNFRELLRCPVCEAGGLLELSADKLRCSSDNCAAEFPVYDGVPVLLDGHKSLFQIDRIIPREQSAPPTASAGWKNAVRKMVPSLTKNFLAEPNFERFGRLVRENGAAPMVLIVGCGEVGEGLERLLADPNIRFVESDVFLSATVAVVADAHTLPFVDGAFDGVICQAVLEHVLDPVQCVSEIYRVLNPNGVLYAEIPFMQQVHLGAYDFGRYTLGGLRYLFRWFDEIEAGAACGPGTVLAWSTRQFFRAMSDSKAMAVFSEIVLPFLIFWLKYLDGWLVGKPQVSDGASSVYFVGRKASTPISGQQVVANYWRNRQAGS